MNNHNCHFIGATGLYPIEEIITNTSNNLINYNILTSNNLINYTNTTSNNLISYTNTTSNNLISYTNTTSNNIVTYYNNLLNTTLPTNNVITTKETILGSNYEWDETLLEPINHLSSIYQVQDNILPQQLDADLSRYYYFNNNILKEAVSKTTLSSYSSTSYYELYKKYFGYVGNNNTIIGGIEMITNDTSQSTVNNATINLSIMLGGVDVSYPFDTYNYSYNAYCIFNIKWNGKNTARILFCGREIIGQGGYGVVQRFVRVQYIERNDVASTTWRNNSTTPSADDYIIPPEYYDGYNSYHYWSFNLQRDKWYIYLDGNLVLTSSTYSTTNFNFGITDLKLEDAHLNLNDVNKNKYQFADVYYFKRHLTNDEILSLSKYHLSQINNSLRVYSTIECDKIICNSIVDYDYTEKIYKPLTFGISQIKNLSTDLSNKEPLLNLTPDRVIISDPNSARGALTASSITSNNLEDMKNLIASYNPVIEFIKDTFQSDIATFVQSNPNIITLGVAGLSALGTWITGGLNAFNANNRIPRRYITEWQDSDGDLKIFYPNLFNDQHARIYITDTFKQNNIYNKQPTITGGATTITDNNLTANRVLISNGDGKVATSNNIDLVKLSYLNDVSSPIGASITSLQNAKQDNLSASSTSIITITNNVINSLWNKSGTNIYYTGGNIGIGTSTITSGYVLDVEGSTEMTNNTSLSDYTLLNPLLSSITKRYVFGFDGSRYAKEIIQNIRYSYDGATYDSYQGINKYVGSISVNTGELYIYDDYIRTYPLDTQSCSFSFWWYKASSLAWSGTEYASIVLFRIDQFRINALYNQRRRVKILYKAYTYSGQNYYKISVEYATNQNDYFLHENDPIAGGQNNWAYSEKLSYIVPNENYFKTPKFLSFNITKTSCTLFINGVQVATNTFTAPNVEFRLEKFYFPQNADYENPNTMNQDFRFWGIYMNYNRLYTANEVATLYRYETNALSNTLVVNGMLKTTALSVGALYVNEKIINIPDAYNQKSLYSQPQEINKMTIQDKSNSVIALSIDNVEINSTSNLINNSGKAGFLFYPNNQSTTIADFKTLTISDITNLQSSLDGKETSFTTLAVSKGGTNKSSYTQNRLLGCITSTTTIDEIQLGTGLQFSGSTLNLNIDQRFIDTSNYVLNTSNVISNRITGLNTVYAPISHTHTITNITGLSQEFINSSNYTLNTSNAISNRITGLNTVYAPISHTHQQSDITGLSQSFVDTSNYVRNTSNVISDRITNLALNNISGTLGVSKGGTSLTSIVANNLLGSGATANTIQAITISTPLSLASGALSLGTIPVNKGGTSLTTIVANRLLGSGATADTIQAITLNTGLSLASGILSLSTVGVGNGGTGLTSIVANNLLGSGATANAIQAITISTPLSLASGALSLGTIPVNKGGTSLTTIVANRLLGSGSTANTIQEITIGTGLSLASGSLTCTITANPWLSGGTGIYYGNNVGVRNSGSELGFLTIGNSDTAVIQDNDGSIVICRKTGTTGRNMRLAYNSTFDFVIGDYGTFSTPTWKEQFKIANGASANSLVIDSSSRVGIGTASLTAQLDIISSLTDIAWFRHTNLTQGVAIGYNIIIARGTNATQDITLASKSTGSVYLQTNNNSRVQINGSGDVYFLNNNNTYLSTGAPTCYGWNGIVASLGRATAGGHYSLSANASDIILRGDTQVIIQNGSGYTNFMIDASNRPRVNMIRGLNGNFGLSSTWSLTSDQVRLDTNGLCYQQNNDYYWTISSDRRIKENIETADYNICYNNIKNIELRRFKYSPLWKDRKFKDETQLGFIAQEVEEYFPKSIDITKEELTDGTIIEDCKCVSLSQINLTLYGAVKKLMKIVEEQNNRIQVLENIISNLNSNENTATQELYKIIQRQNERINYLENIILGFSSNI